MHWRQSSSCPRARTERLSQRGGDGCELRGTAVAWRRAHRRDAGLGEPRLRLHHIRDVMVPLLHDVASAGHGLDVQEDAGVADALDVDRGEEVVHVVAVDVARHAAGGAAGEDDAVEGLEGVRRDHVLQLRVKVVLAAVCAGLVA